MIWQMFWFGMLVTQAGAYDRRLTGTKYMWLNS